MKLSSTKRAQKELDKLPDPIAKNILKHILVLRNTPYPPNSKKLQGQDGWRLRVGSYRVIYTIDTKAKEITILRVGDRKMIYR